jgi:hypothetical protein
VTVTRLSNSCAQQVVPPAQLKGAPDAFVPHPNGGRGPASRPPELPLELVPELPLELVPELPLELAPELPLLELPLLPLLPPLVPLLPLLPLLEPKSPDPSAPLQPPADTAAAKHEASQKLRKRRIGT